MKTESRLERAHSSCVFFTDKFDSVPNSSQDRTDISERATGSRAKRSRQPQLRIWGSHQRKTSKIIILIMEACLSCLA